MQVLPCCACVDAKHVESLIEPASVAWQVEQSASGLHVKSAVCSTLASALLSELLLVLDCDAHADNANTSTVTIAAMTTTVAAAIFSIMIPLSRLVGAYVRHRPAHCTYVEFHFRNIYEMSDTLLLQIDHKQNAAYSGTDRMPPESPNGFADRRTRRSIPLDPFSDDRLRTRVFSDDFTSITERHPWVSVTKSIWARLSLVQ